MEDHKVRAEYREKGRKRKEAELIDMESTHHRWVKASEDRHTLERHCVRIQPVEGNSWYLVLKRTDTYRNLWSAEYVTTQSIIPSILLTERAGNLSNVLQIPARKEGPCTTKEGKQMNIKRDKTYQARMDGLKYALEIVERGGIEELKKEIRVRNAQFIPLEVSAKKANEISQVLAHRILATLPQR